MKNKEKDKVSVIIINYNTPKLTKECIKSIIKKTKEINFEIILVDNGSSDDSIKVFEKEFSKVNNIKIVYSNENIGFGRGNNLGVDNSSGNYLFFLNSDTIFTENSIKILLEEYKILERKSKIGFIQPRLYLDNERKNIQRTNAKIPSILNLLQENINLFKKIDNENFKNFSYADWDRNSSRFVEAVCGAAMFCKRDFFEKIKRFDKRFFLYFEEYDICKRSIISGYKNFFTIKTSIIHLHRKSPIKYLSQKIIYIKSFLKFIFKKYK